MRPYHGFRPKQKQPAIDWAEEKIQEFAPLDPKGKYIISTRIRCGRSLKGYPFYPCLTEDKYLEIEGKMKKALFDLYQDKELKGKYYKYDDLSREITNLLILDDGVLRNDHRYSQYAHKFWPHGRGIYHNKTKTFLIWVNEKDHVKIVSMQEGSDVGQVLSRLIKAVRGIEKKLSFSRDDRLGWLTSRPIWD